MRLGSPESRGASWSGPAGLFYSSFFNFWLGWIRISWAISATFAVFISAPIVTLSNIFYPDVKLVTD